MDDVTKYILHRLADRVSFKSETEEAEVRGLIDGTAKLAHVKNSEGKNSGDFTVELAPEPEPEPAKA